MNTRIRELYEKWRCWSNKYGIRASPRQLLVKPRQVYLFDSFVQLNLSIPFRWHMINSPLFYVQIDVQTAVQKWKWMRVLLQEYLGTRSKHCRNAVETRLWRARNVNSIQISSKSADLVLSSEGSPLCPHLSIYSYLDWNVHLWFWFWLDDGNISAGMLLSGMLAGQEERRPSEGHTEKNTDTETKLLI